MVVDYRLDSVPRNFWFQLVDFSVDAEHNSELVRHNFELAEFVLDISVEVWVEEPGMELTTVEFPDRQYFQSSVSRFLNQIGVGRQILLTKLEVRDPSDVVGIGGLLTQF
jgi:hypothetical protein